METNIIIIIFGVLTSVAIFAIKTGIGCGFASLRRREILYVGLLYFSISLFASSLIVNIPSGVTQQIMAMGVAIMSIIALGMILGGIYTTKQWLSHENDVSRRTFLWLSLPCPVCFTAIFLACMMLSTVAGISNLAIGIIIGTFFFVVIAGTSFVAQKTGSSPATLGNAMIFIGLFYMLSMLIIPAYLQAQTVNSPEFCFPLDELLISFSVMLVIVFLGFISHRRRLKWKYHPV